MTLKNSFGLKLAPFAFLVFLACLFSFTSCMIIKPGAEKSAKSLYETFFVGEEGTQYFIKPLNFESTQKSASLHLDFAFRYKTSDKVEVIVNFGIIDNDLIKSVDSLKIEGTQTTIASSNNKLLFNEKKNESFVSRYSTTISLSELKLLMKNTNWKVTVFENNKLHSYIPTRKTKKALQKLNNNLFVLF